MANPYGPGKPGPGRPKGSINKATLSAREAIAKFVDGNAHRLQTWLDEVARGKQTQVIKDGQGVVKPDGTPLMTYVVEPNPEKAFDMFQKVVEYHIPKLARSETAVTGANGGPIKTETTVTMTPDEAYKAMLGGK